LFYIKQIRRGGRVEECRRGGVGDGTLGVVLCCNVDVVVVVDDHEHDEVSVCLTACLFEEGGEGLRLGQTATRPPKDLSRLYARGCLRYEVSRANEKNTLEA
jgi:hypothetical protein